MLTIKNIQKLEQCKVGANGVVWKILRTKVFDNNSLSDPALLKIVEESGLKLVPIESQSKTPEPIDQKPMTDEEFQQENAK